MPGRCYHDALLHHFNQTPQVSSIIIPLEYLSYSMTRVLPSSGVFSAATGGGKPYEDCSLLCSVAEIFDFYIVCLDDPIFGPSKSFSDLIPVVFPMG